MPVLVIGMPFGRLANRLLLSSHLIAAGIEHGFRVANPVMGAYAEYFPACGDVLCRYPPLRAPSFGKWGRRAASAIAWRLANRRYERQQRGVAAGVIRPRRDQWVDLDWPELHEMLRRWGTVYIQDWHFRTADGCRKHVDAIRRYYAPWPGRMLAVRECLDRARAGERFVIGVHIRHGDYKDFEGGKYYHSHERYREAMERAREVFAGKDVVFVLCSDEPIPWDVFDGLDVMGGPGTELQDLYTLAGCDVLIGTLSTYLKWASYYGDAPSYEIRQGVEGPSKESDFAVWSRLEHEHGETVPADLQPLDLSSISA